MSKQAIILLIINLVFYAYLDIGYIPIIIIAIIWSHYVGVCIRTKKHAAKKWLITGIASLVFVLVFFKYCNFFLLKESESLQILMPLGISYYMFKIISYLIDTYQKKIDKPVNLLSYAVYISFFPQVICGPISRPGEFLPWLEKGCSFTEEKFIYGIGLILAGMYKKLVIADRLSPYVAAIFNDPASYPTIARWMAAIFFSIQLYCDFAGYSEISVGVCNLLGFDCRMNFDKPYFATNIKEFWNQWHISLSTWLKDYIYIPLGGGRKSKIKKNVNIMITFIVSGLWHGNSLNFLCWGLWHGILNMIPVKKMNHRILRGFSTVGTFMAVMFGWVMFRAASLADGISYISGMFQDLRLDYNVIVDAVRPFTGDYSCLSYMLTVCMFIFILYVFEWRDYFQKVKNLTRSVYIRSCFYFASIILFGVIGQNSFLYANF